MYTLCGRLAEGTLSRIVSRVLVFCDCVIESKQSDIDL